MPSVKLLTPYDDRPAGTIFHTDRVATEALVLAGKATYDLSGAAEYPREKETVCFGPYDTVEELTVAYPPLLYAGCMALVGVSTPYALYSCDGLEWVGSVTARRNLTGGIELSAAGNVILETLNGVVVSENQDETPNHRWVAGDSSNVAAITSSGAFVSHPVDARRFRMIDTTLQVVVSGSGTAKLTVHGSMNGVTNWSSMGDRLTGMVAGTGSYILRLNDAALTDWPYYRFTFTETGGTAAVNVKSAIYADDVSVETNPATGTSVVYALGDETIGVSVAASGVQESIVVDAQKSRRLLSTVKVGIVGSGTAKLTVYGSGNPLSNWHNLGDRLTGMTAGNYSLALSDSNIAYFPFYRFVITETGGASVVVATVSVVQKMTIENAALRRVLVLSDSEWMNGANWTNTYDDATVDAIALLTSLGYSVDVKAVSDATTKFFDSTGRCYEFVYFPAMMDSFGWETWTSGSGNGIGKLLKGATPIPVFVAGVAASSDAKTLAALGANTKEATAYRKIKWRNKYWYTNSGAYDLVAQGHMSNLSTFITKPDGSKSIAWKFKGAGSWVYAASGSNYGGDGSLIVHMMAEAILDGVIDPPPKKLKVVIDLDDTPDTYSGTMTIADLDRAYSAMDRMAMPCAFGIQADNLATISADMVQWVRSRTADRGGLLYPIVHAGNWFWNAVSKSVADSTYRANISAIRDKGFCVGVNSEQTDAWGYMYFNNNAFNEETLQLGSPEKTMVSSPLNDRIIHGYGWKVVRAFTMGGAYNTNPVPANSRPVFGKANHRGIVVVGSQTLIANTDLTLYPDDGSTGTNKFSNQCSRVFSWAAAYRSPMYLHGSNLYQTSGNAPGTVFLELLADNYEQGLSSVIQFVHGSALADF